ncbi:MAG: hypothetical protein Q7S12_02285 [bacterium]|nr:hypothetical protein [bacterium]
MQQNPKIGIVGIGMVGKEAVRYFLEKGFKRGRDLFCFDTDAKKGFQDDVASAQIIFVCVPTPPTKDGACDTGIVESVINKYHPPAGGADKIFIVKSTVEPGTIAKFQKKYKSPILFNPEFLTESRAWEDFIHPDRQVVGHTAKSKAFAGTVLNLLPVAYFSSPGTLGTYDFIRMNSSEAEMGKYASNIFGAMKVTYGNVLSDFTRALELTHRREGIKMPVNYENVRKMVSHDRRIGDAWMDVNHGSYRGFGGYCFPKDLNAFIKFGECTAKSLNKKKDKDLKGLVLKGIGFLKAIRDYNDFLLKTQGLSSGLVSSHDEALKKILNNKKKSG